MTALPIPQIPNPPPYKASTEIFASYYIRWFNANGFNVWGGQPTVNETTLKAAATAESDRCWPALCASGAVGNPIQPVDGADYSLFTDVIGFTGDPTPAAPQGSGYYVIILGRVVAVGPDPLVVPGFDPVKFAIECGIGW